MTDRNGQIELISQDSPLGRRYGASPEASYLLRQIEDQIVWSRDLENPEEVWQAFQEPTYDIPHDQLISWIRVYPQEGKAILTKYDLIEFYAEPVPIAMLGPDRRANHSDDRGETRFL